MEGVGVLSLTLPVKLHGPKGGEEGLLLPCPKKFFYSLFSEKREQGKVTHHVTSSLLKEGRKGGVPVLLIPASHRKGAVVLKFLLPMRKEERKTLSLTPDHICVGKKKGGNI